MFCFKVDDMKAAVESARASVPLERLSALKSGFSSVKAVRQKNSLGTSPGLQGLRLYIPVQGALV